MKLLSLASTHDVLPCDLLRTALHATPCMRVITRRCSAVLGVSIVTPSHASCRSCFLFFLKRKAAHLERRDLEEEDDGDGDSDCDCDGNGGCGCDTPLKMKMTMRMRMRMRMKMMTPMAMAMAIDMTIK